MPLKLDEMFKEKLPTKRGTMSVKVISGILGKCWSSPCKNRDIAQTLNVSDGVISEAINNHLKAARIIEFLPEKGKRFNNSINFKELIAYFFSLIRDYESCEKFDVEEEEILKIVIKNRSQVGEFFLNVFVLENTYDSGLRIVRNLYETIPELLLLLILSFDEEASSNPKYVRFLRCVYKALALKVEKNNPILANITFNWFNMI